MTHTSRRDWRFDALRVCMSFLVVMLHVSAYGCMGLTSRVPLLYNALGRVAVPVFYMTAGAMALGRTEPLAKTWLRGLRRIALPLALAVVGYAAYRWRLFGENPLAILRISVSVPPYYHLSFMYTMVELYLILPLLMAAWPRLRVGDKLILAAVVLCLDTPQVRGVLTIRFVGCHVIGYAMLGAALRDAVAEEKHAWLAPAWWKAGVLLAGYLATTAWIMQTVWTDSLERGELLETAWTYQSPLVVLASVLAYAATLMLPRLQLPERVQRMLSVCNGLTLWIYLLHPVLIDLMVSGRLGVGVTWNTFWPWAWIPLLSAGVWAVSAGICLSVGKIKRMIMKRLPRS